MTKLLFKFIIWAMAINILFSMGFALGFGVMAGYDQYNVSHSLQKGNDYVRVKR